MTLLTQPSRRLFLKQASALGALGAAGPLAMNLAAMGSAAAAGAADYKALVCVYLQGGNDAYNTVLPTDASSWANYQAVRAQGFDPIALLKDAAPNSGAAVGSPAWLGGVLPISPANPQGRSFALHPVLTDLRRLFDTDKRLAVLANVGTLVEPVTKAAYTGNTARLPSPLFSHNDQASQWMAMAPEGATRGWGGRMADMFAAANGQSMFTAISANGNAVFLSGDQVKQYNLSDSGALKLAFTRDANGIERLGSSELAAQVIKRQAATANANNLLMKDMAALQDASIRAEAQIANLLPAATATPFGPASRVSINLPFNGVMDNTLAVQLRTVARMISVAPSMGIKRQVFFVALSGFDTHGGQNRLHVEALMQLNHGLAYFDAVMQSLGMGNNVTAFTASDFGRGFICNGSGTDHGWGGHHFVMGGAVKGGDIHGSFPVLAPKNARDANFDASPDQLWAGVMLPKQSVTQVGATLGRWFGLSATQLTDTFPLLPNFGSATDLGFMKA